MPAYSGKFQYVDESGTALAGGPCRVSFDAEKCVVTPASGAPLAFDLGDVERAVPAEFDLQLTLYTGRRLELRHFGTLFNRMTGELTAAWRDRTVRCMLLEDLEEAARYTGTAALGPTVSTPAEIRLYKSNIAVLPLRSAPFQWRLADVHSVSFDESSYTIAIRSGAGRLTVGKLATKTEEFLDRIRKVTNELREQSAGALHDLFPYLDTDRLQQVIERMPEGRSVPLATLAAVHPRIPETLVARAVDRPLRPYFDALASRAVKDSLMVGFKFIREDEANEPSEPEPAEESETSAQGPEEAVPEEPAAEGKELDPLFFWFFFPLRNGAGGQANVAAWEASTGSGRATYFFRLVAPEAAGTLADPTRAPEMVEESVARITRGLALVNFRREPVYLPDEALERQPRFHRYAIGCRKLPDLSALRAAMLGRAIHSSLEKWGAQVESISARAGAK